MITLAYHDTLNQTLWDRDSLKPEIRERLLRIANIWGVFANIPADAVHDIVMTGGNANYSYTKYSDIDVHLIINKSAMNIPQSILDDYLSSKKALWLARHKITIHGYNVELYAQDLGQAFPPNEGVYSLTKNEWIQRPTNLNLNFADNKELDTKADHYEALVNKMIDTNASPEKFSALKNQFKKFRLDGLRKDGEFGFGNLLFKELRNRGVFDRMNDFIIRRYDADLSEDVPVNAIGGSSPAGGPIAQYSPLLFRPILKRKKKQKGRANASG